MTKSGAVERCVRSSDEVAAALADGRPVVGLETTLVAHGLPRPTNLETARRLEAIVRDGGAVPATVGVVGGEPIVGLDDDQLTLLASHAEVRKCSRRDLPIVMARGEHGATTVAGTLAVLGLAGVRVLATGGIGGRPAIPELPGLSDFTGGVVHSSGFHGATWHEARRAIVVGTGSSAHDIALDLVEHGVEVTMVQRGPVVVNHVATANLAYAAYFDGTPPELVDARYGVYLIDPIRVAASKQYHAMAKEMDAELLKGLEAAGMRLGDGIEGQGWLDLFLRTGGGYYLNVGASEAIVEGRIAVLQNDRITRFGPAGAELDDGSVVEADLVVLATGYQNRSVEVADWFGQQVADRVGEIARIDAEGEWANLWGQTAQPGLWFNGGGINQVRPGSHRLALLIKADLDGSIPDRFRRANAAQAATAVNR
jgi:putative flavoprotein involved in K+ transport